MVSNNSPQIVGNLAINLTTIPNEKKISWQQSDKSGAVKKVKYNHLRVVGERGKARNIRQSEVIVRPDHPHSAVSSRQSSVMLATPRSVLSVVDINLVKRNYAMERPVVKSPVMSHALDNVSNDNGIGAINSLTAVFAYFGVKDIFSDLGSKIFGFLLLLILMLVAFGFGVAIVSTIDSVINSGSAILADDGIKLLQNLR